MLPWVPAFCADFTFVLPRGQELESPWGGIGGAGMVSHAFPRGRCKVSLMIDHLEEEKIPSEEGQGPRGGRAGSGCESVGGASPALGGVRSFRGSRQLTPRPPGHFLVSPSGDSGADSLTQKGGRQAWKPVPSWRLAWESGAGGTAQDRWDTRAFSLEGFLGWRRTP